MWYPTPKRASANERALKKGGRGATPRDSLRPGFLLEKAWIPARDRAGNHLAGPTLRRSQTGPPAVTAAPSPYRAPNNPARASGRGDRRTIPSPVMGWRSQMAAEWRANRSGSSSVSSP